MNSNQEEDQIIYVTSTPHSSSNQYEKFVGKKFKTSGGSTVYTIAALIGDIFVITWDNGKEEVTYKKESVLRYFQQGGWIEEEEDSVKVDSAGALDRQEGGNHYKDFKIQPLEFTMANNLDFIQGNIIKYACRHKTKNGAEDLKKVIHYAQLALELQYND